MSFNLNLEGITHSANTANQFTPIITYRVPAGAEVIWPTIVKIIMKLYETGGAELDNKDELYFAYKLPAEKTWTPLTEVFTYYKFRQMSIADQSDENKTPEIKMSSAALNALQAGGGGKYAIFPKDRQIALFLKSSKTYDVNSTSNYLQLKNVEVLI